MADSDEEYERRRRDKFRRERNDYSERRDDRRGGRDQWDDRGGGGRENWSSRSRDRNREMYRDYDRGRRDRYSPQRHDLSPPQMKRMRRDWNAKDEGGNMGYGHGYDQSYGGVGRGAHGGGGGGGGGGGWGHAGEMPPPQGGHYYNNMPVQRGSRMDQPDYPTQPAMMPFKLFLTQQDDNISDEDAIRKYNEYKVDFLRQQINTFFLAHKDEEWFKSKYHPEECEKRKEAAHQALRRRADVFAKLLAMGRVGAVSVDLEKSSTLVKLLDATVILMEGGSDFDLTALEIPDLPMEEGRRSRGNSDSQNDRGEKGDREQRGERGGRLEQGNRAESEGREHEERTGRRDEDGNIQVTIDRKRKRKRDRDVEEAQPALEMAEPMKTMSPAESMEKPSEVPKEAAVTETKEMEDDTRDDGEDDGDSSSDSESDGGKDDKAKRTRDYNYESGSDSSSRSSSGSDSEPGPPGVDDEAEPAPPGLDAEQQMDGTVDDDKADPEPEEGEEEEDDEDEDEKDDGEEKEKAEEKEEGDAAEPEEGEEEPQPRALHKTCSIFLRNLAPTITKQEVEAMCKRYPGFMRVALQDPQPERCFLRRGWVTFDRTVNIVDICWNLNNIRLRDCEMGAIVNRDLRQRVRPVNGVTAHKQVIKADIKHAARIVQALDNKWEIWEDQGDEKTDKTKEQQSFGLVSKNPVLKNITDYLVEEGSFEEDELLGQQVDDKPKEINPEVTIERDEELSKVLDRMILYLRIVHSFDFYSAVEYPNEDEMPHRCGIMHARGPAPPNRITQNDINDWMSQFEVKIKPYLHAETDINDAEAVKLGKKDVNTEVEKFITANTQELGKDKWLCPLSGKKFKGPEFVRKHIYNKHAEKIAEVKQEVIYFDNYLMDPCRPHLPKHPGSAPPSGPSQRGPDAGVHGPGYNLPAPGLLGYSPSQPRGGGYQGHRNGGPRGGGFFNRGGGEGFRNDRPRDRFGGRRDRRSDPRSIIEYRDLDAPEDVDIF